MPAPTTINCMRSLATEDTSVSHFRSSTTSSTWSSHPKRSARPRAKMPGNRRSPFRPSTVWSDPERWPNRSAWQPASLYDLLTSVPSASASSPTTSFAAPLDPAMKQRRRLDLLLVDRGLVESREKGQALILAGLVLVEGQKIDK